MKWSATMYKKNNTVVSILGLITLMMLGTANGIETETPWYENSLHLYAGAVNNAATIDGRGTYSPLDMGSDAEIGLGFTFVMTPAYDLEISVSELRTSGTQYNHTGSGNENNTMAISLLNRKLSVTGKKLWQRNNRPFVPWAGIGLDAALIETTETEITSLAQGPVYKESLNKVSSALGGHIAGGIDIYPFRTSAFALSIEGRYNTAIINGPLDGDINSFAFLLGLRWDFWPSSF